MGVDDDVWGLDSDEGAGDWQGSGSASNLDREWQARQNQFHTLGYRDGVEAGKNSSVQEGFNIGYAEATIAGFNWGVARGITSAFVALPAALKQKLMRDGTAIGRWEGLNKTISSYSSADALRSYYQYSIKPLEASPVDTDATLESITHQEDASFISRPQDEESLGKEESASMAGIDRPPEIKGGGIWKLESSNDQDRFPVLGQDASAPSCSTSKVLSSRPDGISGRKISVADLEETLKQDLVLEYHEEVGPLTVPSTPVRSQIEELQDEVLKELELASIKLSEIAPAA